MTDKTRLDQNKQLQHLTIITFNVNGLFDDNKRQQIFQILENKKTEIILLQETHSNPEVMKK